MGCISRGTSQTICSCCASITASGTTHASGVRCSEVGTIIATGACIFVRQGTSGAVAVALEASVDVESEAEGANIAEIVSAGGYR